MLVERFGKKTGIEFISTNRVGKSIVKHLFISKYENHIVRFICVSHKPENNWKVNFIHWDDKINKLFKE